MLNRLPVSMFSRVPVCVAILALFFVLFAAPLTAHAQAQESEQLAQARARIADLEKEVRVLQAKLTLLETQMKNQATATAETEKPTESPAATPSVTAPTSPATSNAPPTQSPAVERVAPVRKFQSLLQPMQLLPVDLRPKREEGWDRYKSDAANLWFSQQIPGNQIETKFTISASTFLTSKKLVDGKYIYTHRIRISFASPSFNYVGIEFKPSSFVTFINAGPELAKAYEKIDPNIPLRVTGRISKYTARTPSQINTPGSIVWELQDWKIHSPHLPD